MAASQLKLPALRYKPSIYFLDLVVICGPHDPVSRVVQLHVPASYNLTEVRAILNHNERQTRRHPGRVFTPLTVHCPHSNNTTTATRYTLHVDLTADVLCLNNLEDDSTLRFLPRGRTLPDMLPALKEASYLAVPWTPTTFRLECRRCGAKTLPQILSEESEGGGPACPRSEYGADHAWEQMVPRDLLALWPAQFPALRIIYLVVDTGKFPQALKMPRGKRPELWDEREFVAVGGCNGGGGVCYDVDADYDQLTWEYATGPRGAVWAARKMQRWYCDLFPLPADQLSPVTGADKPRCGVLGFIAGPSISRKGI